MSGRLEGRVVMISGGTGGIGREVVRRVLAEGARVSVSDRAAAQLSALQDSLGSAGSEVHVFETDLSRRDNASAWVDTATATLGSPTGLVSVAGFWKSRDFLDVTPDEVDEMYSANFKTAFNCAQAVTAPMLAAGGGSIVNFASTAGEYGSISPGSHYAAAKGAVIAFTKSLARELSPRGIRVNAISPGPIDTKALIAGAAAAPKEVVDRTLVGRLGTPVDIAAGVVYLLEDESSYVTGHVLGINGGSLL